MSGVPWIWVVARASGIIAMAWLTVSMVLGLLMSTRLLGVRRQARLMDLHRTLSWAGLAALALHVAALLADPWLDLGVVEALVPFTSTWRPLAVAAGVIAGWIMVAVAVSFRYRNRIGAKNWRRLHVLAFLAFVLGVVHGLTAGTDLTGVWGGVFVAATCAPVAGLVGIRLIGVQGTKARRATPAGTGEATAAGG